MKVIKLLVLAAIVSTGFASCNSASKNAQKEAEVLSIYVDSVDGLTPVYSAESWNLIDDGYRERVLVAEANTADLSADEKVKLEESKAKYENLKAKYELNIKEMESAALASSKPNYKMLLRDRLFGEGKVGDDMKFLYVTGDNIRGVYENFVDQVADKKSDFTREDWDEINVLYEALDTRKNVVEPNLSSKDNMKIAGLKVRYASIAATHRGGTKVDENKEAKQ